MANDRGRGRRRQDWFGGDGRSGNFTGPRDHDDGGYRRDGPRYDRRDRSDGRTEQGPKPEERERGAPPRDRPAIETAREIVAPGDLLTHGKNMSGPGTYTDNGIVYASQLGVRGVHDGKVTVLPLGGKYMPIAGDEVIGRVQDVNANFWLVEINAPYPAPLHVDESPWQVQIGESGERRYHQALETDDERWQEPEKAHRRHGHGSVAVEGPQGHRQGRLNDLHDKGHDRLHGPYGPKRAGVDRRRA